MSDEMNALNMEDLDAIVGGVNEAEIPPDQKATYDEMMAKISELQNNPAAAAELQKMMESLLDFLKQLSDSQSGTEKHLTM